MQGLLGRVQRADERAARNHDEAGLRVAIATIEKVAIDLRELDPPAAVRSAHRDYLAGFDAFARVRLHALRAVLRDDDERLPATTAVPQAARERVLAARRVFAEHGYAINAGP